MTVSHPGRSSLESQARGAVLRALRPSRTRVEAGKAPDWGAMENALLRELGPVLIDTQRQSASNMLTRQMDPDVLRDKGWPEGRIASGTIRVDAKLNEWETAFPARGTNIMSAASQIVSTTKSRWQRLKASYRGNVPRGAYRQFARNAFGRSRASRIAVTEVTTALTDGENIGKAYMRNTFRRGWDGVWITQEDERVCPICGPLHMQPQAVWRKQIPKGPPAHVNCRCEIAWMAVDF